MRPLSARSHALGTSRHRRRQTPPPAEHSSQERSFTKKRRQVHKLQQRPQAAREMSNSLRLLLSLATILLLSRALCLEAGRAPSTAFRLTADNQPAGANAEAWPMLANSNSHGQQARGGELQETEELEERGGWNRSQELDKMHPPLSKHNVSAQAFSQSPQEKQEESQTETLHLGAKLALFLLSASLLLVLSATALDVRRSAQLENNENRFKSSTSLSSSSNLNSTSSMLQQQTNAELLVPSAAAPENYSLESSSESAGCEPSSPFRHLPPAAQTAHHQQLGQRDQRSPSLSSSCSSSLFCSANSLKSVTAPILGGRYRRQAHGADHSEDAGRRKEECQAETKQKLADQLFLAFSLRNSAAIIFEGANERSQPRSLLLGSRGLQNVLEGDFRRPEARQQSIDAIHGLKFLSMIWIIVIHSYNFALRWSVFEESPSLGNLYKSACSQLLANGTFACDTFLFVGGFLLAYLAVPEEPPSERPASKELEVFVQEGANKLAALANKCDTASSLGHQGGLLLLPASHLNHKQEALLASDPKGQQVLSLKKLLMNLLHRYIRMMPLMMVIIGCSANLLRYMGEGSRWHNSTLMFDGWCRQNWWLNALFLHNFVNSENMCLSHSWYSAVDIQLFFAGQLILWLLSRSRRFGLTLLGGFLLFAQLLTALLTVLHQLPAVPLILGYSEQSQNLYFSEIYVKPYCRASPYLIGMALAYLMRTTSLGKLKLSRLQASFGWLLSLSSLLAILLAMQPAMNGRAPSELQSALYSALSRPLWACATGWMVFACMTRNAGPFRHLLGARAFVPLSRLTYPAFLIHPIVIAGFYGSRQANSLEFSHYLMLYLILGNVLITYASAFVLSALFELPLLSVERVIKRAYSRRATRSALLRGSSPSKESANCDTLAARNG